MKSKPNNIEWIDILRACAMVGVVVIHISTPVLKMSYGRNMQYWWIGNIMDSAVRFSVPLFLMLSGATMLGKNYTLNEYFKKRMLRVFFPFVFWILIYLVYDWLTLKTKYQPHGFSDILHWGFQLFLHTGVSKHFWYIYMILFIYLFIPLIGIGIRKIKDSSVLFILGGWILLAFFCRSIPLNLYNWSGDYLSRLLAYFLFTGYVVAGYYFSKITIPNFIKTGASFIFILSIISCAVLTLLFSKYADKLDLSIYGYLSLNTVIQSTAIFIAVKNSKFTNKVLSKIQQTISNYSFGIYLVHVMIIDLFFNHGIFWTMAYPLISLPVIFLLTLAASFAVIFILRKIPFGKYISG